MGTGGWCLHQFPLCLAELMQCLISADYRWGKDIHETWIRRNEILWFCSDLLGFREEARNSSEKYEFEVKTQRCFSIGRKIFNQTSPWGKSLCKWQLSSPGIWMWIPGHNTVACTTKCHMAHASFWDIQNYPGKPKRESSFLERIKSPDQPHSNFFFHVEAHSGSVYLPFPIAVLLLLPSKPNSLVEFFSCP